MALWFVWLENNNFQEALWLKLTQDTVQGKAEKIHTLDLVFKRPKGALEKLNCAEDVLTTLTVQLLRAFDQSCDGSRLQISPIISWMQNPLSCFSRWKTKILWQLPETECDGQFPIRMDARNIHLHFWDLLAVDSLQLERSYNWSLTLRIWQLFTHFLINLVKH